MRGVRQITLPGRVNSEVKAILRIAHVRCVTLMEEITQPLSRLIYWRSAIRKMIPRGVPTEVLVYFRTRIHQTNNFRL